MKNIKTEQTKQRVDKGKIRQIIRAVDTAVVVKERQIQAVLLSSNPTSVPLIKYLDVRKSGQRPSKFQTHALHRLWSRPSCETPHSLIRLSCQIYTYPTIQSTHTKNESIKINPPRYFKIAQQIWSTVCLPSGVCDGISGYSVIVYQPSDLKNTTK